MRSCMFGLRALLGCFALATLAGVLRSMRHRDALSSGFDRGLEVDLVEALGESMKLEVRLVPLPFAELQPATRVR